MARARAYRLARTVTDHLLRVLFQGRPIATLERLAAGDLQLRYDASVVAVEPNRPLLSVALPVRAAAYTGPPVLAFLEGLLPEETLREQVCRRYHLPLDDTFGLLRAIGGDCAGAVAFVDATQAERWADAPQTVAWLDDAALHELIDELPLRPFGNDPEAGVRISLAGAQNKLAVVVSADARVGLPVGATPSTHILKPPSAATTGSGRPAFPWLIENEAFCLRLAAHAGIAAARVSIRPVSALRTLLIERYDRAQVPRGRTQRLHQEDLCQALGILPTHKYEADGGPSIDDAVRLLRQVSTEPTDTLAFLERVAFNFLIGNNDAHGKNTALLHASGGPRLAPLYDVVSTVVYARVSRRLAMAIGGQWQWDQVTARHWWQQLNSVGFSTAAALRRLAAVAARVVKAWDQTVADAEAEGFAHPLLPDIRAAIDSRAQVLRELPAFVPRGRRRRR